MCYCLLCVCVCGRAWLKEMLTLVRGEAALSTDGADLEQLVRKHEEYRVQMDRQSGKSAAVKEEGRRLVEGGAFMSQEVTAAAYACTVRKTQIS